MVKQTIQIFARVKPTKKPIAVYTVDCEEQGGSLEFVVPRDLADGFINNKRENYKFSVLAGFNGTIFAYGQTGSGKTFTITGGAERYSDRGIIPRTLSYLYQHFSKDNSMVYSTHISYLEIYNEAGYDLLNPQHEASCLEDLPRVTIMEDPDQNIHLKNLSLLQSANEEEALDLLFLGDTNRMIAETPMNQASTRSHCIFTIHLCSKVLGSATLRHSKLHLVDLAGSERVGKTGVEGQILTEAKYINLSLHYLEQVIIALSEKNRSHIPYRNSMMTSVLRDSLGGNCMTTMIATVSAEKRNIDESISTCRFAQRVALIKNDALLNEELDPALLIVRLKKEIQYLKKELALVTGEQRSDELTQEEILKLEEQIRVFLEDPDPEVTLDLGPDMRKIHVCFSLLKARAQDRPCAQNGADNGSSTSPGLCDVEESQINTEVQTLRDMLTQRDNEISILVNMLKKEKRKVQEVISQLAQFHNQNPSPHNLSQSPTTPQAEESAKSTTPKDYMHSRHLMTRKRAPELSVGQQEAFEVFLRDHEDRLAFEDNIALLKHRFAEAKTLGEQVNHIRIQVNELKTQLKMRRMQVAAQGLTGNQTESESDPVEDRILNQIEEEKKNYKITSGHLKGLKTEIEHLQLLREKSKVKLQLEFEEWWTQETSRLQGHHAQNTGQSHASPLSCMLIRDTNSKGYDNFYPEERRQKEQTSFYARDQRNGDNTSNPVTTTKLRALLSTGLSSTSIPLTGDKQTDADILAFVKARHNLLNRTGVAK
ncbi:kinesin-like protein KIF6 isoform X2 [Myxocyprinus asiaticus]|uniref:kinesin-like protein KIF6 isoform X2 n=1 Tax=Myxocyprinus asiaticus TaxID=70543 RepID=UPI002223EAA5|nr:kinesin-like protein KIF6 isoform X2 [Myxocyprinus asiaticus]